MSGQVALNQANHLLSPEPYACFLHLHLYLYICGRVAGIQLIPRNSLMTRQTYVTVTTTILDIRIHVLYKYPLDHGM